MCGAVRVAAALRRCGLTSRDCGEDGGAAGGEEFVHQHDSATLELHC